MCPTWLISESYSTSPLECHCAWLFHRMTALQQKPKHLPTVPEVTGQSELEQEQESDHQQQQQQQDTGDHEEVDTAADDDDHHPIVIISILVIIIATTVVQ